MSKAERIGAVLLTAVQAAEKSALLLEIEARRTAERAGSPEPDDDVLEVASEAVSKLAETTAGVYHLCVNADRLYTAFEELYGSNSEIESVLRRMHGVLARVTDHVESTGTHWGRVWVAQVARTLE